MGSLNIYSILWDKVLLNSSTENNSNSGLQIQSSFFDTNNAWWGQRLQVEDEGKIGKEIKREPTAYGKACNTQVSVWLRSVLAQMEPWKLMRRERKADDGSTVRQVNRTDTQLHAEDTFRILNQLLSFM